MLAEGPVLVGVDGSERSVDALAWAVGEAALRGAEVHAVVINDHPFRDGVVEEVVEGIADRFRGTDPATAISVKIARGRPAAELIRCSSHAQLVVLGARGRAAAAGMLRGSISTKVATHARCPVVVVHEHRESAGPVLVGVDDSPHGQQVLQFAFDVAAARRAELVVMQVWEAPGAEFSVVLAPPEELAEARGQAERSLGHQLAGWREKYPDVVVRRHTPRGHPVAALSEMAREAQLLVVGHRNRRGPLAALLLGSVASGVLHRARCPVAVLCADAQ
ncbi:Nucleotide-binding universal stress protein, UspA family [Saccharopolyspora antimicrobica]|uniref:Nucleotide-binding universal stress UspA family protein n=1 Tax=Saccharopolyspora antimicrobica TaxID=455193 RepID=A0A1I5CN65_9PSEU|nr:universal stress protein [Saccharopolyspora antimicrobica]RKT88805.1 nucleotide-binding universal stress UspA family protein [Saccharopolyspora antimicrobica]SFN88364.1 Nucleotide-binding universal stress protein, UspA family [Saccharopolyspora antimicrobica]